MAMALSIRLRGESTSHLITDGMRRRHAKQALSDRPQSSSDTIRRILSLSSRDARKSVIGSTAMKCANCGEELDLNGCWMVDQDHVCRQCYEDEYYPAPENAAMGITLGVVSGFVV